MARRSRKRRRPRKYIFLDNNVLTALLHRPNFRKIFLLGLENTLDPRNHFDMFYILGPSSILEYLGIGKIVRPSIRFTKAVTNGESKKIFNFVHRTSRKFYKRQEICRSSYLLDLLKKKSLDTWGDRWVKHNIASRIRRKSFMEVLQETLAFDNAAGFPYIKSFRGRKLQEIHVNLVLDYFLHHKIRPNLELTRGLIQLNEELGKAGRQMEKKGNFGLTDETKSTLAGLKGLKELGDLCDLALIHYAILGFHHSNKHYNVHAFTADPDDPEKTLYWRLKAAITLFKVIRQNVREVAKQHNVHELFPLRLKPGIVYRVNSVGLISKPIYTDDL